MGEDSIGLIYTKKKTSKIEVTFYEHKEEGSTSQRANKYYLSGYPDDDESNLDCPAGTYFLNIFLSTTRFNELKELVLNNGVEKIYVSVRTGVLPNLYNEFTTGDWPTVFRYLDNRKFLENPDDMPETVLAKGTIREGGYECEITFSRQPMFRAPVEAAKSNDIVEADEEALYAEEKPRNAHGSQAPISREPILINMSKVALPIWALVIIYGFSQFFG